MSDVVTIGEATLYLERLRLERAEDQVLLLEWAKEVEREISTLAAKVKRYETALRRIAITDDADCEHGDDPQYMTQIARAALAARRA